MKPTRLSREVAADICEITPRTEREFFVTSGDFHRALDRFADKILDDRSGGFVALFVVRQTSILELVALLIPRNLRRF